MVDQLAQSAIGHFPPISAMHARQDVLPVNLIYRIDGDRHRFAGVFLQQGVEFLPAFFVAGPSVYFAQRAAVIQGETGACSRQIKQDAIIQCECLDDHNGSSPMIW